MEEQNALSTFRFKVWVSERGSYTENNSKRFPAIFPAFANVYILGGR
jgi:hypothetical protein